MRFALGMLVACSCGGDPRRAPTTGGPLGSTHVAPPGTGIPDTIPPPSEPPVAVRELAATVSQMPGTPLPSHANAARALGHLADALAVLAPTQQVDIDRIRRARDMLADSHDHSLRHADHVHEALSAATRILAGLTPEHPSRAAAYSASLDALARDSAALDPDRPLMAQHDVLVRALQSVTHTLYAAYGRLPHRHVTGLR